MKELLLVLGLLLAVAWIILQIRRGKTQVRNTASITDLKSTSAYHAVSLRYSVNACDAAKALTGHRFLSREAPQLPLPACDSLNCRCKYLHHADRRSGEDRRTPFDTGTFAKYGANAAQIERRDRKDRRQEDGVVNF